MTTRRRPRLSLDLLRGFRSAARHLSFTRAARELNVTQPAISREIKALEEQLGQPLFRRVNRTLQLTQAGEELFRTADEALELLDAASERLAGAGRTLVSVTTTPALASTWLAPRLAQFARRHPDVDVRVVASNDMVDIAREHVDVALRYVPPWADVPHGDLLVDYATFPVCAPSYLRACGHRLATPDDLAQHVRVDYETVLYGKTWYDWGHWFDALALRPVKPAGTLRFSHYDMAIAAAIAGGGVAIGKWPHLAAHLREGTLRAPLGRDWIARLGGFHVVFARDADRRDAVAAFVAWLQAETRRDRERAPASLGLLPRTKAGGERAARAR
jgi:LysR family transcriptional regulator, glycine cleavage system transcriptional activator